MAHNDEDVMTSWSLNPSETSSKAFGTGHIRAFFLILFVSPRSFKTTVWNKFLGIFIRYSYRHYEIVMENKNFLIVLKDNSPKYDNQ